LQNYLNKILAYLRNNHLDQRTRNVGQNVFASFAIRGASILIGLIMVRITLDYLDQEEYGIWITLSSIVGWLNFFDIGLGHGLRNRFAESIAKGELGKAQKYVSTTYFILSMIGLVVIVVFSALNPFIDWGNILNVNNKLELVNKISILAMIVVSVFCMKIVFGLISIVLIADQKPAKSSFLDLIGQLVSIILVILINTYSKGSILLYGIAVAGSPLLILIFANIWYFNTVYKQYRPRISQFEFGLSRSLFNLGTKFFIIQIAAIVLYQTNNIIIAQLLGPSEVIPYNISYKYFSIINMVFIIILNPFWSAFTEAWTKKEYVWIKKAMSRLFKIWLFVLIFGLILLVVSPLIFEAWIGDKVLIPFYMSLQVFIWLILNSWTGMFSHLLNGIGKIKLQLVLSIGIALINIPLAVLLGRSFGIHGILLSNIILALIGSIIYPIQSKLIVSQKATGLWNE
jgi:O-antigen/teichoic acid export membrane protein